MAGTYTLLTESQPDVTFETVTDGDITVDSRAGRLLTFVIDADSDDSQGGIIGSWVCDSEVSFSFTVTGSDATVVQIRFKRLLDNFVCK